MYVLRYKITTYSTLLLQLNMEQMAKGNKAFTSIKPLVITLYISTLFHAINSTIKSK